MSHLLLTADLKGEVEDPGYYFHRRDAQTYQDLDALMLTQGWVSYNWNKDKALAFEVEKRFAIRGKVIGLANKPAPIAKVILSGRSTSMIVLDTVSNANGDSSLMGFLT